MFDTPAVAQELAAAGGVARNEEGPLLSVATSKDWVMTMPLSRRHFLQAAGAGAAVWVPAPVKGYSGAGDRGHAAPETRKAVYMYEMSAFAAQAGGEFAALGVSMWDLDTPALVVELDALDANISTMQRTMEQNGIASRPHAKTHKCPAIARMQLETGSVGICVAKVSEAEALFEHGIDRLLMTTSNVTPFKIRRAMHLRKWCPAFIQATDTPENARDLSAAAEAAGVMADVVVDVDPGGHRTGITPGEPALSRRCSGRWSRTALPAGRTRRRTSARQSRACSSRPGRSGSASPR